MKRCFSMALILALLGTGTASFASAEEAVIVSESFEAEVAAAELAGETGLTMEGEEIAPEQTQEQAVEESPAVYSLSLYARVETESAAISADAEGQTPLAALRQGDVLLVVEWAPRARVALYTERGILEGYADEGCLARLSGEEEAAYLDAAASGAVSVALYEDRLELPLVLTDCAFADEAGDAPEAEAQSDGAEALTGEAAPAMDEAEAQAGDAAPATDGAEAQAELPAAEDTGLQAEEQAVMAADAEAEAAAEEPKETSAATGIQLSAKAITIGVKEPYTALTVTAVPEGSALPAVTWRSSNTKYVKVNASTGKITGVKKGSATVYAKAEGGEEVACTVTVKAAPGKITLKPTALTLSPGMSAQLNPAFPKGTAAGQLKCSSSKESVATVDANGLVTAVSAGSATITVQTYNGKKAKCKVTVMQEPAAVVFPCESVSVAEGQTTTISATALGADGTATQAAITYAVDPNSQDAGCITLDAASGKLKGVRKGQAVVIASTHNGVAARCAVSVAAAPKSVSLSASSVTIGVKEAYSGLTSEVVAPDGEDSCATAVTWSSSNKKIAKVDADSGVITGVAKGSCTITVKTANGKKAKCKVTVKKAPSKISSMTPKNGSLTVGETGQYKVSLPSGTGGSIAFSSDNDAVATIDDSGVVTAVAQGTAIITARTYNGKTKSAKLTVKPGAPTVTDDTDTGDSEVQEYKSGMTDAERLEYVIYVAQSKLGKPYVYGSFGPNSFDCSGFTTYCFRQISVELKHSAYTQGYDTSQQQLTMEELRRGDLVFFDTVADSDASDHAGIYLGSGKFIHASSSAGKVIVSNLASGYYNRVFSWGRRVLG